MFEKKKDMEERAKIALEEALDEARKANNISEGKIFISHSSNDHDLVTKFVEHILILGLGIKREHIFCTSVEGLGIRSGEDFKKKIHQELLNAKAIIQIITKNYKTSEVCLNEMGAAWVTNDLIIPLVADPFDYDVGFIHANSQQLKLNNETDLLKLYDDHKQTLFDVGINITNYSKQIKSFLDFVSVYGERSQIKEERYFFYGKENTIYGKLNLGIFGHPIMERFEDSVSFHEYFFLEFEVPIDVLPDMQTSVDFPENTACFNISRMHIASKEDDSDAKYKELIGKKVAVTGELMHSFTQWHKTQVLMWYTNIKEVKG